MRKAFLLIATALSLTVPTGAYAMKAIKLDFAEGKINAEWRGQGDIAMQQSKDGILLQTKNGTGMMLTSIGAEIQPQSGLIRVAAPVPTRIYFTWTMVSDPRHEMFTIPFGLMTGAEETKQFSLRGKREWQAGEKKIGIVLPPNSTILLMDIELQESNIIDGAIESVRSFWTFDEERPYSINFVWGPQIGLNAAERSHLYDLLPPPYISGTLALNVIIILLLVTVIGLGMHEKRSRRTIIMRCAVILMTAWILFDLRMGSEFLSWVIHDHRTYIAATEEARTFRDRERFYDFATFANQFLEGRKNYVFFAPRPWPYLGNIRYLTYPALPGIDYTKDDTWVIYNRPDMSVDADHRLAVEGQAVTPPGTVLGRFDDTSFVFRITK